MQYNYLLAPFTLLMSINLKKSFNPSTDLYKYQINTLVSQVSLNVTPQTLRDILKFQSFLEMFSYSRDLKRFRPPVRIQTFIDQGGYTPLYKKKRQQVIRDWFELVLWYVRLRRASKGATPYKLLEVEEAIQAKSLQNAISRVKRASVEGYEPYFGSDDEAIDGITPGATPVGDEDDPGKPSDTEIDAYEQFEKQEKEAKKN